MKTSKNVGNHQAITETYWKRWIKLLVHPPFFPFICK